VGILEAALEEALARLPDEEWSALTARVRPPKTLSYTASANGTAPATADDEIAGRP
jgi:hypothetical protein